MSQNADNSHTESSQKSEIDINACIENLNRISRIVYRENDLDKSIKKSLLKTQYKPSEPVYNSAGIERIETNYEKLYTKHYRKVNLKQYKPDFDNRENNSNIQSTVYCVDNRDNLYKITFKAVNIRLYPIHFHKRNVPDKSNDKVAQPDSVHYYQYKKYFNRPIFLQSKHYLIVNTSKTKLRHHINRLNAVLRNCENSILKTKKRVTIAEEIMEPSNDGKIYLNWCGIEIIVQPKIFQLESIRHKTILNQNDSMNFVFNFGQVLIRYKNDIALFKFESTMVTLEPILSRTTRGNQVQDNHTYLPYTSLISHRKLGLRLPLSNFFYKNPMLKHYRENWINAREKHNPRWMTNMIKERRRLQQESLFQPILDRVMTFYPSTCFMTEVDNVVYKYTGELLKVLEIKQRNIYESMVRNLQMSNNLGESKTFEFIQYS